MVRCGEGLGGGGVVRVRLMVVRVWWVRQWAQITFQDWITAALPIALALVIMWIVAAWVRRGRFWGDEPGHLWQVVLGQGQPRHGLRRGWGSREGRADPVTL